MIDPGLLALAIGAPVVATAAALWHFVLSPRARLRRRLANAPITPIGQARSGTLVRFTGRAEPEKEQILHAPLTGRACVLFEVTVEDYVREGRSSSWKTIIRERDFARTFWLEDRSGRARIELDWPELILTQDAQFSSGFLKDATPELEAFLARHQEASQGMFFNRTMRYREAVIEPGEPVTVLGLVHQEADPEAGAGGGYRQAAFRIVLRSPPSGSMVISDEAKLTRAPESR